MAERFPNRQKTLWEKHKLTLAQFVLSSQCFQKDLFCRCVKTRFCLEKERVNQIRDFRLEQNKRYSKFDVCFWTSKKHRGRRRQEGHDGPVSLHWLIREIHSYQTLHFLGIGLKHKTSYRD